MTQPVEVSTAKPVDAVPAKAEGVDLNAAMKAFRDERAKDEAVEKAESAPASAEARPAEPAAQTETQADAPEAATVDVPEKEDLKVRLRSQSAKRQRAIEQREQQAAAREAQLKQQAEAFEAQQREISQERARIEALKGRAATDPRSVLKELGIHLPDVVNAELAELSPEARSRQMAKTLENLPKLIEEAAEKKLAEKLKDREEAQAKQQTEQQRQQAIAQSEKAFIDRAKDAEKHPHLAKVAGNDGRFALHTAYYIQSVFHQEHGRLPTDKELDFNVNKYLGEKFFGDTEAPTKAPGKRPTSPRASAKEVAEKPIAEMSEEERLQAASREFRRIREADKSDE